MWKLFMLFVLVSNGGSEACDDAHNLDISFGQRFSNGDIYYNRNKYTRYQYFTDNERTCVCKKQTCLLKCCPYGYGYNPEKKECFEITEPFSPKVVDQYLQVHSLNATEYFDFNFGKPNCTNSQFRIRMKQIYKKRTEIRTDGKLYIEVPTSIPPWILRGPDKYCVDTFIFEDDKGKRITSFDALVCFADEKEDEHYVLSSTCMIISCVFILATVAVYGWLPELRNLHGRVLMAYLLCLFVGFICMATMQILLKIDDISVNTCVALSIICYFSLLAAFFWLNVMCFDIWWTFSGNRGMSMEKMSVQAKFYAYSIYAFSIPTALTIIMVSLEFSGLPPHPLLPSLRHQGCFLYGKSKLFYLYGPIVILWFANMVFFILTAVKITQIKKQISVLKCRESAKHDKQNKEKQRLLLYIKLFIVMGISWLLEVISAIYPKSYGWRFVDAYNVLIGLIIFIIFVCKRKILGLLKKRIKEGILRRKQGIINMTMIHRNGTVNNLRNYKQRDSLDTIRSSCPEAGSNKTINTTNV
ncbi:probable G-protein coupled receptor Mth-like 3 isoform X3 [Nymphalis io]|uniref:probable G-protein coupled receptor Mth-like 3 isoform X3 n=1 Tax=Inachis io TaxID=171585 RepID=UPI00216879FA|nr:probable G-protein coupled receptor Mth-like 3 isoform X3 [Nymphalis io]XP_050350693.1 probable G-protein coupled receptor Mth-like 3 isoform X3 [Nymphalis io]